MRAWLAIGIAAALAACGKGPVTGKVAAFGHGPLPESWRKTEMKGLAVAYYHAGYGATAGIAPLCEGISDYTLESLAQQELVGLEEREVVEQGRVTVDGREAIDWVVKGSVDGVAMQVNLVVFRKDGCVYDLNLVSRPETFARAREDFRVFVNGFVLKD
jgi:hypothetical protein